MKAITVNGCRDCPYTFLWRDEVHYCGQSDEPFEINIQSTTPHPDCKLPDLPTDAKIYDAATEVYTKKEREAFEKGANYILNAIKK